MEQTRYCNDRDLDRDCKSNDDEFRRKKSLFRINYLLPMKKTYRKL